MKFLQWLFRRQPDVLPPPDGSVHRGPYLADQQQQYISRLWRQG